MHYPADVSREQLRLGSRQCQAIIQGIEKSVSGNPAPFLNKDAVHVSKLHGRTSKAQQSNAWPHADVLAQAHPIGCLDGDVFDESLQRASFLPNHVTSDAEIRTPASAVQTRRQQG